MAHVSDIKLIRTDTTLDLSQKAEKGMIFIVAQRDFYICRVLYVFGTRTMWDIFVAPEKKNRTNKANLLPMTIAAKNNLKTKHNRQDTYIPIPMYLFYATQVMNVQILTKNTPKTKIKFS